MAHEVAQAGYILLNPCLSVYTDHWHESDVRRWHRFPTIVTPRKGRGVCGVSLEALKSQRFEELRKAAARK